MQLNTKKYTKFEGTYENPIVSNSLAFLLQSNIDIVRPVIVKRLCTPALSP